jgi:hypothetical protein
LTEEDAEEEYFFKKKKRATPALKGKDLFKLG